MLSEFVAGSGALAPVKFKDSKKLNMFETKLDLAQASVFSAKAESDPPKPPSPQKAKEPSEEFSEPTRELEEGSAKWDQGSEWIGYCRCVMGFDFFFKMAHFSAKEEKALL